MLFEIRSDRTLQQIEEGIETAAARHNFGVMAIHDLRETMRKKGVAYDQDCRIYEVCNPQQAKKVLEANGAVSTALPCRISVYGDEGGYRLATLLPTGLMKMLGSSKDLEEVAQEVEATLTAMMREAAGVAVPKASSSGQAY